MAQDPKNLARRTVPAQATLTPIATPACEVDFANHSASDQTRVVGIDDFPNEFMSRNTFEPVVPAKQFDIRVTDAATQKPDNGITLWAAGFRDLSDSHATLFKMDRDHAG
jgi:hypothetical protein